jgi:hypothetical protein
VKKRPKPFTVSDFMPAPDKQPKKKQTPEEMLTMVKMINAAHGGKVL